MVAGLHPCPLQITTEGDSRGALAFAQRQIRLAQQVIFSTRSYRIGNKADSAARCVLNAIGNCTFTFATGSGNARKTPRG
jgi:hypothetical protein